MFGLGHLHAPLRFAGRGRLAGLTRLRSGQAAALAPTRFGLSQQTFLE